MVVSTAFASPVALDLLVSSPMIDFRMYYWFRMMFTTVTASVMVTAPSSFTSPFRPPLTTIFTAPDWGSVKSLSVSSGAGLGAAKPAPEAVAVTQNIAAIMIMV